MDAKFDDLLARIVNLPAQDRARLLAALKEPETSAANTASNRTERDERSSMTFVTVALPDDLAQLAKDAGLLAEDSLEGLLRRELYEYNLRTYGVLPGQKRRLVRNENGYLVVEALPGEKPITSEQVKQILDDMEW